MEEERKEREEREEVECVERKCGLGCIAGFGYGSRGLNDGMVW